MKRLTAFLIVNARTAETKNVIVQIKALKLALTITASPASNPATD
jgi:hypothetical protein